MFNFWDQMRLRVFNVVWLLMGKYDLNSKNKSIKGFSLVFIGYLLMNSIKVPKISISPKIFGVSTDRRHCIVQVDSIIVSFVSCFCHSVMTCLSLFMHSSCKTR